MYTYVSVLIQIIVSEFKFVERHRLLHPMGPGSRRIRMYVESSGHVRFCFSGHYPFRVVVFVTAIVNGDYVDEENIFWVWIQTFQADF